jgi:hypothetical protein
VFWLAFRFFEKTVTRKIKMKRNLLFILWGLLCFTGLFAQTSDDMYQRPLRAVLLEIQDQFHVRLIIPKELGNDKILNYADWRRRPWSLEQSLTNVLAPFDMKFVKQSEGVYKIKDFEYPRRVEKDGEDYLNYLTGLYNDLPAWEARKQNLKTEMLKAIGLSPMPKAPGTRPIITNKRVYDGYTVENVALEILPGVYTCGTVYKPLKAKKCPVIINPNGHFGDGRYRSDEQYRCAMQAKMGAISVGYDLFAWGESLLQFDSKWHRKSIAHTIQTLNAIRWIDYLSSLKEADPSRVGITGASGGGSQTMLVTAIDDRITVSVPVVMTSSFFCGGCPCESGMPIHLCGGGTNNAEIAAMCAPRPLMVISDGKDWTSSVPVLEYPFIRRTFGFYGKEDLVENAHFASEGHDYGLSKRQASYAFLAKYLGLNAKAAQDANGKFDESKCTIEKYEALYVFGPKGENFPKNAVRDLETLKKVLEDAKK